MGIIKKNLVILLILGLVGGWMTLLLTETGLLLISHKWTRGGSYDNPSGTNCSYITGHGLYVKDIKSLKIRVKSDTTCPVIVDEKQLEQ